MPPEPGPHQTAEGRARHDSARLSSVLQRNIAALQQRRRAARADAGLETRIADTITRFAGSMSFVYVHLVIVAVWVVWNQGWLGLAPFDPSYVILATVASVEAIFISTFVLIAQNRAAAQADQRDDLDLQINLLAEHEITRLLAITAAIAERLGIPEGRSPEISELKEVVLPEAVLERIEAEQEAMQHE